MKSDSYLGRIWKIFSPTFLYLAISLLVSVVYMSMHAEQLMTMAYANTQESYDKAVEALNEMLVKDGLWLTGIMNILCIPFLGLMMRKDSRRIVVPKANNKAVHYAVLAILGVASTVALNFLLAVSGIIGAFESTYSDSATIIFSAPLWMQFVISAVLGPIMEEMIFRGIIYKRMRTYAIVPLATLVSAIFFGIYHMNILQFIYAGLLGLILAYVYEKFHSLIACIVVHGCGNAFSVLMSNDIGVANMLSGTDERIAVTAIISSVITIACIIFLKKIKNDDSELDGEMYKEV